MTHNAARSLDGSDFYSLGFSFVRYAAFSLFVSLNFSGIKNHKEKNQEDEAVNQFKQQLLDAPVVTF